MSTTKVMGVDFARQAQFTEFVKTLKDQVDAEFTEAFISGDLGTRIADEWKLPRYIEKLRQARALKGNTPLQGLIDKEIATAEEAIDALIDIEAPELKGELRRLFDALDGDSKAVKFRVEREYPKRHQPVILEMIDGFEKDN